MSAPRTSWITHKGRKICFLDFHGVKDNDAALRIIAEARQIVRSQPPNSTYTLTYVKDSTFNKEVSSKLKELASGDRPFVKAAAIVGLGGLQHALYVAVSQFSGRRIATFHDLEKAKDWLAEQP